MVARIASLEDPRAAPFRGLRDANHARAGRFIAEGVVVVETLLSEAASTPGRFGEIVLLLLEKHLEKLAPALAEVPGAEVLVASGPVLDEVVGFHLHRGCLAVAERPPPMTAEELLTHLDGPRCVVVVLEGLTNHDNVGSIFRNAAALGASAVLLDERSCDPLYRKATRVAVGATLSIPWARFHPFDPGRLHAVGFTTLALTPHSAAPRLDQIDLPPRLALLLGTEGTGLAPQTLAAARVRARIPMRPGTDSLNVATACGIALYVAGRATL